MANCNDLFHSFNGGLEVTPTKKAKLNGSKGNVRKNIVSYFQEHHPDYKPKFWTQGSYKMKTLIRTKDDMCDLDDGVYFIFEELPSEKPEKIQSWVKKSVDGVADATPQHRNSCIRVIYASEYNIDLPVLVYSEAEDKYYLATKNGWKPDDPKAFLEWFNGKNTIYTKNGQLKRIVRYLKSWCNQKSHSMPSGLIMTIWAANNFVFADSDDEALLGTLEAVQKKIKANWVCFMPTNIDEGNLLDKYDDSFKARFLDSLQQFIDDAKAALDEENYLKASRYWRKHLGDRFPLGADLVDKDLAKKKQLGWIKNSIATSGIVTTKEGLVKDKGHEGMVHSTSKKGFYGGSC